MIEKFVVSRDDSIYEAFPDVTLTASGKLVCVFLECTHHGDRSYTCNMLTTSTDRGRTWSKKRPLGEALRGEPKKDPFYDCPRIVTLSDGRLAAIVNRITRSPQGGRSERSNWLLTSDDEGETWSDPQATPVEGVVPDQLIELKRGPHVGRWIISAHMQGATESGPVWVVRCWMSDDQGETWTGPHIIAREARTAALRREHPRTPWGRAGLFHARELTPGSGLLQVHQHRRRGEVGRRV